MKELIPLWVVSLVCGEEGVHYKSIICLAWLHDLKTPWEGNTWLRLVGEDGSFREAWAVWEIL